MNPTGQPSRLRFEKSLVGMGILGIAATALIAGIPFLSLRGPTLPPGALELASLWALSALICLLVALLAFQRFAYQGGADLWYVALGVSGFALFALLQLLQEVPVGLPWPGEFAAHTTIPSRLYLATYLVLASANSRRLVRDRQRYRWIVGGSIAAVVFWLSTLAIGAVLLPRLAMTVGSIPVSAVAEILIAVPVVVAGTWFAREFVREQNLAFFLIAVASAALLGQGLARLLSLPAAPGATALPEAGLHLLISALLLLAMPADLMRFVRLETALRRRVSKTNAELSKSERAYRTLVDNLRDGIATLDRDGRITYCNPHLARLLETDADSLRGHPLSDWIAEDQLPVFRSELRRLAANQPCQFEVELITTQKKRVSVYVNAAPVVGSAGTATSWLPGRAETRDTYLGARLLLSDLGVRRRVERRLAELMDAKGKILQVYEQCLDQVTQGVFVLDRDRRATYINRAFEEMTGYRRDEVLGSEIEAWLRIPALSGDPTAFWRQLHLGRPWRGEVRDVRKDGSRSVLEVTLAPLPDGEGSSEGYLGVLQDITRQERLARAVSDSVERLRRRSEEKKRTEHYYQSLLAGLSDIVVAVDTSGQCLFLNPAGQEAFGCSAAELNAGSLPGFLTDLKRLETAYGNSIKVELEEHVFPVKGPDGSSTEYRWRARPLFDHQGKPLGVMAVGRDTTDVTALEKQLEEQKQQIDRRVRERTAELEGQLERLRHLLEIDEEIRLNTPLRSILQRICRAVQTLGWQRVWIALTDPETGASRIAASAGFSPDDTDPASFQGEIPFASLSRFFQERFRIGHCYFVDEPENGGDGAPKKRGSPEALPFLEERPALAVPFRSRSVMLGIVWATTPADLRRPTAAEIAELEAFAEKAAFAIESDEARRQQKENEVRTRLLAEITRLFHSGTETPVLLRGVVERSIRVLGDLCAVVLIDEEAGELRPAAVAHRDPRRAAAIEDLLRQHPERLGEGLAGRVVALAEPLFLQRVKREVLEPQLKRGREWFLDELDPRSLIVVPLQLGSVALGAIYYVSSAANRSFTVQDLRFAQELADRLALALENARLFEETQAKARELARASRLKSEFLANVSHELRTPLHTILTFSDILLREKSGSLAGEQRRQVEIIQRNGRSLLALIEDILDLSKIEAGATRLVPRPTDLHSLIHNTAEPFRALCSEKGLHLEVDLSPGLPQFLETDADKLAQVLRNLLSNATKFTNRGEIVVRGRPEDDEAVIIEVQDTGIGIPSDRFGTIFEAFQQLDGSDSRRFGGVGLGLAIARRVIHLLGGEIEVDSQVGRGSRFTLRVPRMRCEEVPAEAQSLPDTDRPEPPGKRRARLLVVDDDADAQYALQYILEEEGYEVAYADSGQQALRLARKLRPDAILLDMMMPGMDGYKTVDALKADPVTRRIPVIATTAKAMRGDREQAIEAGCSDYLAKPFEASELIHCVQRWIEQGTPATA